MGHALDVLRVATTLSVVGYHAGLAYLTAPMRLTLWFYDARHHVAIDTFVYAVNVFAMPLFFLAAGIPAPAAVRSRGAGVFLRSRVDRLLRPLLFGTLTLVPLCYLLWGLGLEFTGRVSMENIASWTFDPVVSRHAYGVGHLWFLEYLFLVCLLWVAGGGAAGRLSARLPVLGRVSEGLDWLVTAPARPILLAIPTATSFLIDTDTLLRIPNDVTPDPMRLLHYAYFFTVGGWLAAVREPKARFIPWSRLYLGAGVLLFAVMTPLMLEHAAAPLVGGRRVAYALMAALCPWLLILGSLGVLLRTLTSRGPVLRFLAESSFWIYLIHLPIVGVMQLLLLDLPVPGLLKLILVTGVAVGVSLWSYQAIVRYSLLAEIINGARKRSNAPRRWSPERGWQIALVGLVLIFVSVAWYHRALIWGGNLHAVVEGRFYRSGRLSDPRFQSTLGQYGIRTVITFGGGEHHAWYRRQAAMAQSRGATTHSVSLRADRLPAPSLVRQLIELHDHGAPPFLMQGYRGIDESAFAVALFEMLDGVPPEVALRAFSARYGSTGGPRNSLLGIALLDYQNWLKSRKSTHTPDLIRLWAAEQYLVWSIPAIPWTVQQREVEAMARIAARSR